VCIKLVIVRLCFQCTTSVSGFQAENVSGHSLLASYFSSLSLIPFIIIIILDRIIKFLNARSLNLPVISSLFLTNTHLNTTFPKPLNLYPYNNFRTPSIADKDLFHYLRSLHMRMVIHIHV